MNYYFRFLKVSVKLTAYVYFFDILVIPLDILRNRDKTIGYPLFSTSCFAISNKFNPSKFPELNNKSMEF